MKKRRHKRWVLGVTAGCLAGMAALLAGPVATWLQAREAWLPPGMSPDAYYLTAGARDQQRRVDAMAAWLVKSADPSLATRIILVGNDTSKGRWCGEAQRNLTLTEWAERRLDVALAPLGTNMPTLAVVPGRFTGTDGEMEALAAYVEQRPAMKAVALVSSPFHLRRLLRRLETYAGPGLEIYGIPSEGCGRERSPFWVTTELIKLGRDALGLARMPMLSRGTMRDATVYKLWALAAVTAVLAYAWLGYPLLLGLAARWTRKRGPSPPRFASCGPVVTFGMEQQTAVIIAAHNEAAYIGARIENLLTLSRLPDSIWIGVDGSDDGTALMAQTAASRMPEGKQSVHILDFPERRGKAATLKALVAACAAEAHPPDILVFSDANTAFEPDALEQLRAPFADPGVGGVCGKLRLTDTTGKAATELGYWTLENRLKRWESTLDSCLGANGAIYAVRRPLFWQALPDNTIVDDFVIGMKVRQAGWRMVYVPEAQATEPAPEPATEWARRVRIGAGDYQALWLCAPCLHPRYRRWAWMFFSHKIMRWFTPHLLLSLLGLTVWLLADYLGREVAGADALVYKLAAGTVVASGLALACAAAQVYLPKTRISQGRLVKGIGHFTLMQMALFAGFLRFCRGNLKGSWTRTPRGE